MKSYYSKSRDFRRRNPEQVNRLVSDGKLESLQLLSQQYLKHASDDVRFGFHNNRCIFGACPAEMLHLVLIGWFKNVVESFFMQAGRASNGVLKAYNKLCFQISGDLRRHSDRELPCTAFSRGFSTAANMPGNECTGWLPAGDADVFPDKFVPRNSWRQRRPPKKPARAKKKLKVGEVEPDQKPRELPPRKL